MNQVTIGELRKLGSKVKDALPCELVSDGEVIAVLVSPHDVSLPVEASTKCHKLGRGELYHYSSDWK